AYPTTMFRPRPMRTYRTTLPSTALRNDPRRYGSRTSTSAMAAMMINRTGLWPSRGRASNRSRAVRPSFSQYAEAAAGTANTTSAPTYVRPPNLGLDHQSVARPSWARATRKTSWSIAMSSATLNPITIGRRTRHATTPRPPPNPPATVEITARRATPMPIGRPKVMIERRDGATATKTFRGESCSGRALAMRMQIPVRTPAARPAAAPPRTAVTGEGVTVTPALTRGRTRMYPTRKGGSTRRSRPSVMAPPTRLIELNVTTMPTSARYTTMTPPSSPNRSARRVKERSIPSHLLRLARSEEAPRPEDQHEDQDGERDDVLQLVRPGDVQAGEEQRRGHGFEEPQDQAAECSSGDAPDATQHRRREGFDAQDEPHERPDHLKHHDEQDCGHAGKHAADHEGHDHHTVHVDPHEAR